MFDIKTNNILVVLDKFSTKICRKNLEKNNKWKISDISELNFKENTKKYLSRKNFSWQYHISMAGWLQNFSCWLRLIKIQVHASRGILHVPRKTIEHILLRTREVEFLNIMIKKELHKLQIKYSVIIEISNIISFDTNIQNKHNSDLFRV